MVGGRVGDGVAVGKVGMFVEVWVGSKTGVGVDVETTATAGSV